MKPTYRAVTAGQIENHLVPYFRDTDLSGLTERDLLAFIDVTALLCGPGRIRRRRERGQPRVETGAPGGIRTPDPQVEA